MISSDLILDKDGRPFGDPLVAEQVAAVLARETGRQYAVSSHQEGGYGLARQSSEPQPMDDAFEAFWFRPAWRSQLGKLFPLVLGVILFSYSDQILALLQIDRLALLVDDLLRVSAAKAFALVSKAVSLFGLSIAALAAFRALFFIFSHHYYIGPWGIEANTELVARDQRRIEYRHIRGVNLRQGIIDRLLGIGTLDIATSGAEESEVQFIGVGNPNRLLEILRERLRIMA